MTTAGGPDPQTTHTIPNVDVPIRTKALSTLTAEFALAGFQLHAELGIDGVTRFYATCCGKVETFISADTARAFLAQIGGIP